LNPSRSDFKYLADFGKSTVFCRIRMWIWNPSHP